MKPSSAMSLASNRLGHSALFCALAGSRLCRRGGDCGYRSRAKQIAFRKHLNAPSGSWAQACVGWHGKVTLALRVGLCKNRQPKFGLDVRV